LARVNKERRSVHADRQRAQELRYHPAFGLGKELSGRRRVVGDERARDSEARLRGDAKLPLFVLSRTLSLNVIDPTGIVERI
jgi:hypothetical protein